MSGIWISYNMRLPRVTVACYPSIKNEKNIKARKDKGQGIVDQIMSILESTVFGPFQFEVALTFRASLLLNGILTNSEAGYGLKTADVENLDFTQHRRRIQVETKHTLEFLPNYISMNWPPNAMDNILCQVKQKFPKCFCQGWILLIKSTLLINL